MGVRVNVLVITALPMRTRETYSCVDLLTKDHVRIAWKAHRLRQTARRLVCDDVIKHARCVTRPINISQHDEQDAHIYLKSSGNT